MSGTIMKFGPQWIRTLTDGAAPSPTNNTTTTANTTTNTTNTTTSTTNNNNNSSISSSIPTSANYAAVTQQPATAATMNTSSSFSSQNSNGGGGGGAGGKYKLAEYRYGREEMLALFEEEVEAPEDIKKFTDLYVEKVRIPMAMTQMSEEELKLSTKNWNSDALLRSTVKSAAAAAAAAGQTGFNAVSGSLAGVAGGGALGSGPAANERDTRQLSDRGATGALTAAGVLSSSPRGPPGSLSRIPLEQRGMLSSLSSRGPPSSIRNLVGRGTNMYMRSQSHDDESADEIGSGSGASFDTRFGLPGQARQPNSLRARFETNRTVSGAPGSKPIDIKGGVGGALDGGGELSTSSDRIGRSVFDRLPNKYSVDDKIIRKDTNGRPLQSAGDWRSREWSNSGSENRSSKLSAGDERSWRSSRGGAAEDWRSNSNSTSSSSWYVRTDDQRGSRGAGGAPQNQENLNSGFSGKRDTLRRPSADGERHDDDDDDVSVGLQHQPRHRRDSLPEWSIGDPLSGDKVGSFDASGAFREIARDDGSSDLIVMGGPKDKQGQQQQTASSFDTSKSSSNVTGSSGAEQEWRLKTNESSNTYDTRNLNGIDTSSSLSEMERLSLSNRNVTGIQQQSNNRNNAETSGSNESRSKQAAVAAVEARARDQDRFNDVNFQNSMHNKMDLQSRTSPQTTVDNEHKKSSFDNLRNSVSPQSCQRPVNRTNLPANLQQMLKKQPNNNSNQQNQPQQQMFLSALGGGSSGPGTMQQTAASGITEEDGFAHLERAAEIMVAEWTAEEEHEPSSAAGFYLNKIREQQDAQVAHNADTRLSNQAQQQQQQQPQQPHPHPHPHPQQGGSEQNPSNAVFDSNNQKKFILLPFNHEDSQQWFYRDTQGVIQGPFSGSEMFEWYKAGYFVKELLVRRACDELFYPLGDVIKMWDRIPFASIPMNVPPPPPITGQTLLQFRAVTKQLELAVSQGQIPPNAFGLTHPATVLLHGPLLQQQQQQQQQVHQVLAATSLNQNISGPQERQAGIRQILDATRQHDQTAAMVQQQQQRAAISATVTDQNEMQTQLRQLLAQLKNREGFSNLNAQEQQEVLVRQFVASRNMPTGAGSAGLQQQQQQPDQTTLLQSAQMMPFLPFFSNEQERFRYQQQQQQQRLELERHQKEEAEKAQGRFIMEQRLKAEEEKQRIMDEMQKRQRKQKEESEKQRQEAEKERLLKLSQLKQQQLAKQQEEFRQQMQNQQRIQAQQQQEKKQQQQQLQQIERAKKAAQAQQVQQEQQRKTAWSTVSKPDQEPVSLATLQKMQEEEKEKERERQRQIQQQIQSSQQQQQQLQLQRQMTWANAAQQNKPAPVKTLAEIQKEEEERLAREKQTRKTKVVAAAPTGVWNNAASHLSWKNPPADS